MTRLAVNAISLQFGGLRVLRDVSLTVATNELVALIGPNGAGKTTVFNCISGLLRPSGDILFQDRSLIGLRPSEIATLGVARTFQHAELVANMTVLDNLLAARHAKIRTSVVAEMLRLRSAVREEKSHRAEVEKILSLLGIERVRDRLVADLPFGVQKVVGFARALVMNPTVLLLDEPSAGLTGEERHDMARFITEVRRRFQIAIIWIEHDMQMVTELADRVVVLDYGRMLATGRPREVLNDPDVVEAYLGTGIKFKRNVERRSA